MFIISNFALRSSEGIFNRSELYIKYLDYPVILSKKIICLPRRFGKSYGVFFVPFVVKKISICVNLR